MYSVKGSALSTQTSITESWRCLNCIFSATLSQEVLGARKAEIWSSLDEKTKAVYGEAYLERLYANLEAQRLTYPTDVAPVTSAMRSALFSKRPQSRYTFGRGACVLLYLVTILPSWISDRLSMALSPTSRDAVPARLQQQRTSS